MWDRRSDRRCPETVTPGGTLEGKEWEGSLLFLQDSSFWGRALSQAGLLTEHLVPTSAPLLRLFTLPGMPFLLLSLSS